ncbi:hormogonium polysaccharide biosynthesis glycosyltransferase HpsE [Dendronalium sp. ChiSLP03b]|uniref:hormogonium polysaccharide biosynthesis glycosyltransferase HpsE n=1 Tax=Dendronalium sp. ChiSLP03b TaxID=3075381 RepID=UPI002AD56720|nr:hormogonium polysaccharide biosynthesis glycosyltransferase HpsE [Dendronalium sp. ChiSLP03b]MDZ8203321.1 hormogonium polysaccharide biosynthesis glycosyltransferase HpsE [Dendronalium sp. ChiSLP03b]
MSIDFTVAIPTYNGINRLPKVLECLRSQKDLENLKWEIIVVDNNSTDDTAKLVQEYQASYSEHLPLRYCFEPEQGLAFARSRAVKEAQGEFVGFLDDDNLPASNWVIAAYKFGQEHPKVGAYSSQIHGLFEVEPSQHLKQILFYLAINERGSQAHLYEPRKKGFPPGAGLVVRRQVWQENVPRHLFLIGRVGSSMLPGEDSEALFYIHKAGWEIWYNPAMEMEHIIPSWRLERNYLISLMRGIGLSRYYLRLLLLKNWQKPFAFLIYLVNDLRKLVLYFIHYHKLIKIDTVAAAEMERLFATFISPFYFGKLNINKHFKR